MSRRDDYLARFARVVAYVDAHAHDDADLTVERLSTIAAFSKFHFHRQWTALYELGVGEYVQLVRLKRAVYALAFRPRLDRRVPSWNWRSWPGTRAPRRSRAPSRIGWGWHRRSSGGSPPGLLGTQQPHQCATSGGTP